MTVDYLRQTQLATVETSRVRLAGLVEAAPIIENAMFQLAQRLRVMSNSVAFGWWAHNLLIGIPYTVNTTHDLLLRGSYFETTILYRHLLEALVQLRYYNENLPRFESDQLWQYKRAGLPTTPEQGNRTRPDFKQMFEELAPGLYVDLYGPFFSNASHGGTASAPFRWTTKHGDMTHTPGATFDEGHATFLLTNLLPVLHGLIRVFIRLDPVVLTRLPASAQANTKAALDFLHRGSQQDWETFEGKRELLSQLDRLADWPTPVGDYSSLNRK